VSIPTLTPADLGDDTPIDRDARAAGIADAYDEHTAGTPITTLEIRAAHLVDHLHTADDTYTAYVFGYAATALSLRLHQQATATAQTQIAYEDHEEQENHR
jgi:hypothetical protein